MSAEEHGYSGWANGQAFCACGSVFDSVQQFERHAGLTIPVTPGAGDASKVEALFDCSCGHSIGEHNGIGCYARVSYTPLVTCECPLTDDRTHGELLAPRLATLLAAREAAARAEERERIAQAIDEMKTFAHGKNPQSQAHALGFGTARRLAARIARGDS